MTFIPIVTNRSLAYAAGVCALVGVVGFVFVVTTLHFLQSDYDASEQMMSELALGPHGWAMFIAFSCMALSAAGTQALVRAAGGSKLLRWLLGGAAVSFLASGAFPLGRSSELHIFAIALAFVLSVLAIYLFPSKAGRASLLLPKVFSWSLAGGVAASVALGHSVLPMGVAQRLAAGCLLLWFGVVAWRAIKWNTTSFKPPQ